MDRLYLLNGLATGTLSLADFRLIAYQTTVQYEIIRCMTISLADAKIITRADSDVMIVRNSILKIYISLHYK